MPLSTQPVSPAADPLEQRKALALRRGPTLGVAAAGGVAGPALVVIAWWLTRDRQFVGETAWCVFVVGMAVLAGCYSRAMRCADRLRHLRRQVWMPAAARLRPVAGRYQVRYDYDRFTAREFEALRVGQLYLRLGCAALFAAGTAVLTWTVFTHFVWS